MALLCIPLSKLVSFAFSTISICPLLIPRIFHLLVTQYGSTVYIGIAMVFVFPPYIREIQFLLSVSSQLDF